MSALSCFLLVQRAAPEYWEPDQGKELQSSMTATTTATAAAMPPAWGALADMLGCWDAPNSAVAADFGLARNGRVNWNRFLEGSNNGSDVAGCAASLDSGRIVGWLRPSCQRPEPTLAPAPLAPAPQAVYRVEDCGGAAESRAGQFCGAHRSVRRCQVEGCGKCAQGATQFCIAHGGGRRCTIPDCFKSARDKFFCAAHGGGRRCAAEGCGKSAVGGSHRCTAHGGGRRCQYPQCAKSAQSNTLFCVRHGGGRLCTLAGCTKVARGKTEFCAAHGGGTRCGVPSCGQLAVGGQQWCRRHSAGGVRNMKTEEAPSSDDADGAHRAKRVKVM